MKISVVSPSVRPEGLDILGRCLKRQDFQDFEWIIVTPQKMVKKIDAFLAPYPHAVVSEPAKRPGDYYRLSGAFNVGFAKASGQLVVVITDLIWFPPNTLSHLWSLYETNPKALVTAIGHQYTDIDERGVPINIIWQDPRSRTDLGSFYEVAPSEMEMCLASIPKEALIACGGIDEDYDKGSAVGEKEMCWRLDRLGYRFFIDQALEYRAIKHPRLNDLWDEKYKIASALFVKHMEQLHNGTRQLNVNCLNY